MSGSYRRRQKEIRGKVEVMGAMGRSWERLGGDGSDGEVMGAMKR